MVGFIPLLDPSARCQQPAQPWNELESKKMSRDEGKPEANLWSFINFSQPSIYHKVSNWKNKTKKADDYREMKQRWPRGSGCRRRGNPSKIGCKLVAVGVWRPGRVIGAWWMLSGAGVLGTRSSPTSCSWIKAWRDVPDKIPPSEPRNTKLLPQRLFQMMVLFFFNDKFGIPSPVPMLRKGLG